MSTTFGADIGYGIQLTDEALISELNEGTKTLPPNLKMMWAGDAFSGNLETFIVVSASHKYNASWSQYSQLISPEELIVPEEWETELLTWADACDLAHAPTGWWLATSLS